jgi:hypothetical protein
MRQKKTIEIFNYWNRIRAGRPAPEREEIEPSDIRHLLSETFILEVSGALRTISYRLAGTRLCGAFGRELKGYGYLGHWDEQHCFEVAKLLSRVYRDLQPHVISMRGETANGRTVDYEVIFLPLVPMSDGSARILGLASTAADPYWLGTDPIVNCKLRSFRALDAIAVDALGVDPKVADHPALSPSLTPPIAPGYSASSLDVETDLQTSKNRRIAHLVVHDGGRQ